MVPPLTAGALDPMCVWQLWHPTNAVYWDFFYTDFTVDSVARLSLLYTETLISAFFQNSSTDGDAFSPH